MEGGWKVDSRSGGGWPSFNAGGTSHLVGRKEDEQARVGVYGGGGAGFMARTQRRGYFTPVQGGGRRVWGQGVRGAVEGGRKNYFTYGRQWARSDGGRGAAEGVDGAHPTQGLLNTCWGRTAGQGMADKGEGSRHAAVHISNASCFHCIMGRGLHCVASQRAWLHLPHATLSQVPQTST